MANQYTNYPNAIDTSNEIPKATDNVTRVDSEIVNRYREAILAIESELGIQPSGTYASVRARLDALELTGISGGSVTVPTGGNLAQYHDNTHNPVVLLQLNGSLTDSSGNGNNVSVTTGTARYGMMLPGIKAFFFDGLTQLQAALSSTYQIAGSITIELFVSMPRAVSGSASAPGVVTCGTYGPTTEVTNVIYDLNFRAEGDVRFLQEFGAGGNETVTITNVAPTAYRPIHFACVRDASIKTWYVYIDGTLMGQGTYTNTVTGGTSSPLNIGWAGGSDEYLKDALVASIKIINGTLTGDEIKAEYNRTLGQFYGQI